MPYYMEDSCHRVGSLPLSPKFQELQDANQIRCSLSRRSQISVTYLPDGNISELNGEAFT